MLLPTVIALYFGFLNIVYLISPVAPRYYFKLFSNKRPPRTNRSGLYENGNSPLNAYASAAVMIAIE